MPISDVHRIDIETRRPRIVELHFALQKLRSVVSFMNSGAHPDDETSAMLAALGFRDGLDISYVCANRGEGGQNDIGTEAGSALGTLRTAEMEQAANILDLRLYWLSLNSNDAISDFGFSKSGVETLKKWGHEHSLQRFVSVVRQEKPDILCPTFLDIPGQHGHHRAMTQLAQEVMAAAADPNFKTADQDRHLEPWTISKLYLPAWGGGGAAYDDELPPPAATLTITADGVDEVTGWSWELIGQQSRRFHLTQGMGRWVAAGSERNWPLHLEQTVFGDVEQTLTDHLPYDLSQLAEYAQAPQLQPQLQNAQNAINEAVASFPEFDNVMLAANSALSILHTVNKACPPSAKTQIEHRLNRKITQLSRVIRLASGVQVSVEIDLPFMRPGNANTVMFEQREPTKNAGTSVSCSTDLILDSRWDYAEDKLSLKDKALPSESYPLHHFPDSPRAPAVKIELTVDNVTSQSSVEVVKPPLALPETVVNLSNDSIVINRQSDTRDFSIAVEKCYPSDTDISVLLPDGWTYSANATTINVRLPEDVKPGLYELVVCLNGLPAQTEHIINYSHVRSGVLVNATKIDVLVLDVTLPKRRIAYVGGGNDRVAQSLMAMGVDVTELDDSALSFGRDLNQFDTVVVGLFAMRTRPELKTNMPHVHTWIEHGGHLLTLYHRPWDEWDAQSVPPRQLEIGQPSLRFRVTDENATVKALLPEHALLNSPNKITNDDWANWHKERGLYFAKSWDDCYKPLLSMHDPSEEPLIGSLLSAEIGKGRHTHTSLILHHQMAHLVPGSFRLMANLLN